MHLPIKGVTDLLGGSSQKNLKMGNKISYAYKSKSNQKNNLHVNSDWMVLEISEWPSCQKKKVRAKVNTEMCANLC